MAGNAAHIATNRLREAALDVAAEHLGASPELLRWKGGAVVGGDGTRLGLGDLAALARTAGKPLEETVYYEAAGPPVANGVHAAVVEVDPENGEVSFHRYVVVHDCGTMINPTLVEGQIVGGLVQGSAAASWRDRLRWRRPAADHDVHGLPAPLGASRPRARASPYGQPQPPQPPGGEGCR